MRPLLLCALLAAVASPFGAAEARSSVFAQRSEGGVGGAAAIPFTMYECVEPFCSEIPKNVTGAIQNGASPGMVLGAFSTSTGRPLFVGAFGRHTYSDDSAVTTNVSRYDMASLSKIIGATTAVAVLYQKGFLDLDERVASDRLLGPNYANKGKGPITIRNLLLHNAGYPPDPTPGYADKSFPCAQNQEYFPGLTFNCDNTIYNDLLFNQGLANPVGKVFVYSDLSMITLMFVVGKLVKDTQLVLPTDLLEPCVDASNYVCYYNAFLAGKIWPQFGFENTGFCPTDAELTPPEWEEYNGYRHQLVKGYVSDSNAYALGGISGHAGVFSNIVDGMRFMRVWMSETNPSLINQTTIDLFTTVGDISQSSRALGWDTNDQSYKFCGDMSPKTFTHTGYTGTELCGDPVNGIATVMLTNARYPNFAVSGMSWYRPQFNTLVHDLYAKSLLAGEGRK